jgi:hypothetical protein
MPSRVKNKASARNATNAHKSVQVYHLFYHLFATRKHRATPAARGARPAWLRLAENLPLISGLLGYAVGSAFVQALTLRRGG